MTNLSVQTSDIDLPLRVVSYREIGEQAELREYEIRERPGLLREPRPRYDRGKPAAMAKVPGKVVKPHPFNKDFRWKMLMESLPREFLRFFAPWIAAGMDPVWQSLNSFTPSFVIFVPACFKKCAHRTTIRTFFALSGTKIISA